MKNLQEWTPETISTLCRFLFPGVKAAQNLSPTQCEIIRTIMYAEHRRISISAHTRFGKTQSVAIGIALFLLFNGNKKILFIGPTREQAEILRNYMSDLVVASPELRSMAMIDTKGAAKLKKEASKRRMTFTNGSEYRILTAHGDAGAVMGHGGDVIVIDEAAMITREAYAKITRMLGDDPANSILIEMYNPWTKDCMAFDHYVSGVFKVFQIGWEQGLKEGRVTEEFVEERRKEYKYTPLHFTVLYDSMWPDEAEDQLISFNRIKEAVNRFEIKNADEMILGCDIADKGTDRTVLTLAAKKGDYYQVQDIYAEAKSESVAVSSRILSMMEEQVPSLINIDSIGVGVGVLSMVKNANPRHWVQVQGCHFGKSVKGLKFANKKAQMYWRLKMLFEEGYISIPDDPELIKELNAIRWEYRGAGKISIIDPEGYSPDYADSLVYAIWGQDKSGVWHVA